MGDTSKIKVLIAASEFEPYTDIGHLGRMVTNLSIALVNGFVTKNLDVRVVIPYYKSIPSKFAADAKPVVEFDASLGRRSYRCKVFKTIYAGVPVYLLYSDNYFEREQVYSSVVDDIERYSAFCNAVLNMINRIDFSPDIIQCHDWHMSYIPTLYRTSRNRRASDKTLKTLFVIHSMQYQGICSRYDIMDLLDLTNEFFSPATLEFYGQANSMKGGLLFSTKLATVSSNYAREIQHGYYGENLEGIIRSRSGDVSGIMCGIDASIYNPVTDSHIFFRYDESTARINKSKNKEMLQKRLGLSQNPDSPLLMIMSDVLDYDKGIDLVQFVFEDILALGVQVVFASKGRSDCHEYFLSRAKTYPGLVAYVQYRAPVAGNYIVEWDETGDIDGTDSYGGVDELAEMDGTAGVAAADGEVTVTDAGNNTGRLVVNAIVPDIEIEDAWTNEIDFSPSDLSETMLMSGSDILLRPSRIEPCGEKHLIALKYGTVPVVRETGGLNDVVVAYNEDTGEGNGFSFFRYNAHDMLNAIKRAVDLYQQDGESWNKLVRAAMRVDMTWEKTAEKYAELYKKIVEAR